MVMTDDLVASVGSKDCFSLGTPKNQVEDTPNFFHRVNRSLDIIYGLSIKIMHIRTSRLHLCWWVLFSASTQKKINTYLILKLAVYSEIKCIKCLLHTHTQTHICVYIHIYYIYSTRGWLLMLLDACINDGPPSDRQSYYLN